MKTFRSLPPQDLANIAPLSEDKQYEALWRFKLTYVPFSYSPVRDKAGQICNVLEDGILPLAPPTWNEVRSYIAGKCYNEEGISANLQVADGLHEYVAKYNILGRVARFSAFQIGLLDIGFRGEIKYWNDMIISVNGKATIPFIDPRKAGSLTEGGRRFVFSVMNERIRRAFPDFSEVALAIFQFERSKEGPRAVIENFDSGIELYDFETLNMMIRRTYALWRYILEERQKAEPQRKTGSDYLL